MNEQDASSIRIEADFVRKCSKERFVLRGDVRFGPRQGLVTTALLVGLSIGTARLSGLHQCSEVTSTASV
jgi:hypothetical protein